MPCAGTAEPRNALRDWLRSAPALGWTERSDSYPADCDRASLLHYRGRGCEADGPCAGAPEADHPAGVRDWPAQRVAGRHWPFRRTDPAPAPDRPSRGRTAWSHQHPARPARATRLPSDWHIPPGFPPAAAARWLVSSHLSQSLDNCDKTRTRQYDKQRREQKQQHHNQHLRRHPGDPLLQGGNAPIVEQFLQRQEGSHGAATLIKQLNQNGATVGEVVHPQ